MFPIYCKEILGVSCVGSAIFGRIIRGSGGGFVIEFQSTRITPKKALYMGVSCASLVATQYVRLQPGRNFGGAVGIFVGLRAQPRQAGAFAP